MRQNHPPILPIAYVTLRVLILLNWLFGACILGLLVYTFVNEPWTMRALGVSGYPDAERVATGMRAVAGLGLVGILLHYAILKRLLAIVVTVGRGDPFVADNAYRLHAIAWVLLALQMLSLVVAAIAKAISTPAHPFRLDAGFSTGGWLAVILTFVLARVFAQGTVMRQDLDGTV